MAITTDGSPEPQEESARPKARKVRAEDVRIVSENGGKGSEGVFPGPRQTAVLLKARAKAKRDKK